MTVDVEDYFHVSAFSESIDRSDWGKHTLRVERNTHQLLDLFDERGEDFRGQGQPFQGST